MRFTTGQSALYKARQNYQPLLPAALNDIKSLTAQIGDTTTAVADVEELETLFPHTFGQNLVEFTHQENHQRIEPLKIGIVFSGGQAPGGHNVVCGLFDALKKLHKDSTVYGFQDGPSGILQKKYIELTPDLLNSYRNQGGFDLLGAGRTKIEKPEQLQQALEAAIALDLDGLVIVGGDDSNTNAAVLAEFFKSHNCKTRVIGVPKTIDGDLKNEHIHTSFGFDTASKIYSDSIANICRDALSAKKYYHFIKLMGRSASHITLECAMQTQPNLAFIGEEIANNNTTLKEIIDLVSALIRDRAKEGKDYGVILIPEGLIEFIPEIKVLIAELNEILAHENQADEQQAIQEKIKKVSQNLSPFAAETFAQLPDEIKMQLLLDRDPHGNVQVSKIETEKLLILLVEKDLKEHAKRGEYNGKFNPQPHFLGYEGRSAFPSNFDSHYCYALGHVAALAVQNNLSGYMCQLKNLQAPVEEWAPGAIPITMLLNLEVRHGKPKPVIQKALVDLTGKIFNAFRLERNSWKIEDKYRYPGPIQFFGERSITDRITLSLEST